MAIVKVRAYGRTRYRVDYREPGKANPKRKTFDTKGEAQSFEDAIRAAKNGGPVVRKVSNQTLEDFGLEYVEKYASVELAPATLAVNRSMWNNHIRPRLGAHKLSTLCAQPELVQGFKADLLADGVGEAAVRKALSVLGAVLAKAVEWNRIPSNPATTVKKPSGKRKRRIAALAPEAVESIRDELSDKDALLVSILAYSGLRPGEALALEWSDIGKQSISVTKALSLGEVGATKTHVDRMVPLLKPLAADLKTLRGIGLVFPRSDGQPWSDTDYRNWRGRVWQPAAAKAGIATLERKTTKVKVDGKTIRRVKSSYVGPRPYDLRHSMASLLIGEGRNVAEIAETMGHSIAILLGTYAHVIAEHRGTKLVPAEARIKVARASTVPKAKAA